MIKYKVTDTLTITTKEGKELTFQPGAVFNSAQPLSMRGIEEIVDEPVYETFNPWWYADYGVSEIWNKGFTGKGVKVAVLDSGIYLEDGYPHKDLEVDPNNLKSMTNCSDGMIDTNGHGLHISGIIKASNNGYGVTGIAFDCEFYFAKVSNRLGASPNHLINGIKWAIEKNVDIINISRGYHQNRRGFSSHKNNLKNMVLEAYKNNILVVCASGQKTETSGDDLFYPARFNKALAVGGINQEKSYIDNTISTTSIPIFAPGKSIKSTSTKKSNFYKRDSGSSQACAFVSGISALIIQKLRSMEIKYNVDMIKELLVQNTDDKRIINPLKSLKQVL